MDSNKYAYGTYTCSAMFARGRMLYVARYSCSVRR